MTPRPSQARQLGSIHFVVRSEIPMKATVSAGDDGIFSRLYSWYSEINVSSFPV